MLRLTISLPLLVVLLFAASRAAVADTEVDVAAATIRHSETSDMRLEISLSARELYVFIDGEVVDQYPVAVGQEGHETPTGTWEIYQVDWNPDWTPPDSEWSEDREDKEAGDSDNPMGRVRMIFDPPYSIHGTDALESLGTAASHGSIRMANDDIIELAPRVMDHGGDARSQGWVDDVLDNLNEMVEVTLPDPVRIDIIP